MRLRVKEIAAKKNIMLKDIAAEMNITYARLYALLNQDNIQLKTLIKLASALNCDVLELIQPGDPRFMHIYNRDSGEWLGIRKIIE